MSLQLQFLRRDDLFREPGEIEIVNGDPAVEFRRRLDIAANPVCQRCVCSLYLSPGETPPG